MLRRLYRCVVRLHPASFRRRFGEEMIYIFDQQRGPLAALGVMLDCVLSLLKQWTLRPHISTELPASPLRSPTADHLPSFASLDPFQPRASAVIHGALLSLILFYMTVVAIPYSWIHILNLHFPETAGDPTQPFSRDSKKSSGGLQVDVIPAESGYPQTKPIASSSPRTPAPPVRTRGATIWLDPYVGSYISNYSGEKIWIQIEGDPGANHLSISLAGSGHSGFALSPVSPTKFMIAGVEKSYVVFTADFQGRICCLSWVVNGDATGARR